jgi:chromosome segregation ATPase
MKKKIILIALILCGVSSTYSQDCCDKVEKQALVIDSLQKVIKAEIDNSNNFQQTSKDLNDTIKTLKTELLELKKIKEDTKAIDTQLQQKSDSIVSLKSTISEKNRQIDNIRQDGDKNARAEFEKGKAEVLTALVSAYKKPFDDLLRFSTKESVRRDLHLVDNNSEVAPILLDLGKYFTSQELLENKFDAAQIKNAQNQLNQIKRQSALLDKLKESLEYYQDYSNALKETIGKLVDLDKRKNTGGDTEIQKLKFNDIVTELSDYMYNYYDYDNYPHLSNIVLEIIKRKKPNADADITDLLNKL